MLDREEFLRLFTSGSQFASLANILQSNSAGAAALTGLAGSAPALYAAACSREVNKSFLFILNDRESAAYFFNDLEQLLGQQDKSYERRNTFFFPSTYKTRFRSHHKDKAGILLRSEVINRLAAGDRNTLVVTYPEALAEKVAPVSALKKNLLTIRKGEQLSVDFIMELFVDYGFEHVDFVAEPGHYSLRGSIIDVFPFSNDLPFRIEIMNNKVESLRSFDSGSQLSVELYDEIHVLPDIHAMSDENTSLDFLFDLLPPSCLVWLEDTALCRDIIRTINEGKPFGALQVAGEDEFMDALMQRNVVEFSRIFLAKDSRHQLALNCQPQPGFNKQFDLLTENLKGNTQKGFRNIILFDTRQQAERIKSIVESLDTEDQESSLAYDSILLSLHEGFVDQEHKLACYTDHQIFDRYHRFRIREKFPGKQALSIKALHQLKPGDYVTHIDHGVGIFSGLEKIEVNGRLQEAIRLIYKNNDILYVSIHSMHRIARYTGKEGHTPALHRLGSNAWNRLKEKTKKKVKEIAHDLIALYAKRKAQEGFSFSPDSYLQHELEASFIFEDTPDQEKATQDVKKDMESSPPMDRLICGDVGFGKTEVAMRAAFKAVADSKQVAVLVPTTILALQHYYTFQERLKDFPCKVEYLSRFRKTSERKAVLQGVKEGRVDILIGTHSILSKDLEFRDLGLLIVDEEQKFGVSMKEKLRQLKVNIDTLTLTATPIPRTLQFSLMGARDLSYINTPPPNRYPIITEVHMFNEELIREAIMYEIQRGGQVFFVHNRIHNIEEVAAIIQRNCPDVRFAIGHGRLTGTQLEKIMLDFINGEYDVLVSTSIIESGLDIPNANTIIINNAHHFGLSDLHQLRGRVGRTNKKAFCYLLSPPMSTLTSEARKRLKAIEEFSELGSGFHIALRDLDIRGAGNLLGAEQSGFITELGFETYHKILDEAINELKNKEYKELYSLKEDETKEEAFSLIRISDCQVETDLELMIPSDYVSNIEERLQLYKELDNIPDEEGLGKFAVSLEDRFGLLPDAVTGLMQVIRLRWRAKNLGMTKIILKSGKMIAHLPDSSSRYYESQAFGNILQYARENPRRCLIRENKASLTFHINKINDINEALHLITDLSAPDQCHS